MLYGGGVAVSIHERTYAFAEILISTCAVCGMCVCAYMCTVHAGAVSANIQGT